MWFCEDGVGSDSKGGSDRATNLLLYFKNLSISPFRQRWLTYSTKELRCTWTRLNEWNELRLYFSSGFDCSNSKCPHYCWGWHFSRNGVIQSVQCPKMNECLILFFVWLFMCHKTNGKISHRSVTNDWLLIWNMADCEPETWLTRTIVPRCS